MTQYNGTFICLFAGIVLSVHADNSTDIRLAEANSLFQQKKFEDAKNIYRALLADNPSHQQVLLNLGISYFELNEQTQAEQIFQQLTKQLAAHVHAYLYLGKIARKNKKTDVALDYFHKAVLLEPTNRDAVYALTEELKEQLRAEEAIGYLRTAVAHHPNDINLEFTLANTLNMAGQVHEALALYLKLNTKHPSDAGIIYNIAFTYKKLGLLEAALPFYTTSLRIKPDHQEALFSQGLAYMVVGDWEKGWQGYEHRWTRSEHMRLRAYTQPLWKGEDLAGKTLFVCAEQGLGDTFQFIRYLKILKERGAYIIFAPQRPLMTLLALCPYIDKIIPFSDKPTHFDYHIPLVSIPSIMGTRVDSVPCTVPYLHADEQLVEEWRVKLAHDTNIKIGICWQGNSEYNTAFLRAAVAGKSMPVANFEPLTHIPGVSVYSLQHTTGVDQLNTLPSTMKLITFGTDLDTTHGRFMDTAAIIKNLDIIITVDTSICHLAAGLGKLVWNLLPNPPDWRWMLNRTDTPWYPNMRLFRQPTPGDWHTLIADVTKELITMVTTKKPHLREYCYLLTHYNTELALLMQQKQQATNAASTTFLHKAIDMLQAKIALLTQLHTESDHA
jgi:tetratricopeptide (TPR) repeat protein